MAIRANKGGAPEGIKHGKASHSYDFIEMLRDMKEIHGISDRMIYAAFPNIPRDTIRDWLYYRTRTRS